MDTSEAGMGSSGSSDSTAQPSSHTQQPQQVSFEKSNNDLLMLKQSRIILTFTFMAKKD